MTRHHVLKSGTGCVLGLLLLLLGLPHAPSTAQEGTEPRTIHNACAGNCVADTIFLHSGMGDTQAKYAYHGWFDSYYTLTGCGDPAWKTDILFLLDIIGDAVGAPGGNTMQCWQGLAAQGSLCSSTCSDYFITDARYAPNLAVDLDLGEPGYLEVTLDNASNLGKLPELQPNAYTRRFTLRTTLAYQDGEALLVDETSIPSLSFPNWITRGGLDDCITQYGADSSRCTIISDFDAPSVMSTSVEFLDGALYDLSDQISDLSDANGSFSQQGYVRLLSDGDSLTIAQGAYAGYALIKTHYLSSGQHTVQLVPWDASTGSVTLTNHECNSWLSTCWVTGTRNETDTYVYALHGPADKLLEGSYTVEVVADVPHEKDFTDNRVSYTYDASAVTEETDNPDGPDATGDTQPPAVSDLRVITIPGPGLYPATLGPDLLGYLFKLSVPDEVNFMFLRLVSLDGGEYSAFVRRGSIPVPNYPTIADDYQCWAISDASYSAGCPFSNPYPDDYYIFVHRDQGGGAYRLEVEWTIPTPTPTVTPTSTPTEVPTATPTTLPTLDSSTAWDETEPNDTYAEANLWAVQDSFSGQLASWIDGDVLLLNFSESGIYTFTLTDVGPELRIKMTLKRADTHATLGSGKAAVKGGDASLTFDASAGEQYYLVITATAMSPAVQQPYTLVLSGFIPDPDESNDSYETATAWNLAAGPVTGYFWDQTTGRRDYFTFVAPTTLDASPITFTLSEPDPALRVRLTLLRANSQLLSNTAYSVSGQPVTLSASLDAGTPYVLMLESQFNRTSLQAYTLSAQYTPAGDGTLVQPTPTASPTALPPTATPPPAQPATVITGQVWRLFPDSAPAGVGAASLALTVNGVEQPGTLSQIDGTYRFELVGLQPGDMLTLRAAGTEDTFEPVYYQWQTETGVSAWSYDFYSYWGTLTPPANDGANHLYGYVRDAQGQGVPGVRVLVRMGTSDALQVLGPTDSTGYFEGYVRLPSRIMVSVWTETPGYAPAHLQFFHAYAPEDRVLTFTQAP